MAGSSTLSRVIGADSSTLPVCLCESWDTSPLLDEDKKSCISLLAMLMRDRGMTQEGATIALSEWDHNPALAESEVTKAFASTERLTCKLIHSIEYVSKHCEKDFCEYPSVIQKEIEADRASDLEFDDVCDESGKDKDGNPKYSFNHSKTADAILAKLPVALGEDGLLYYWQGSIWTDKAEAIIHNKIHDLVGKLFNRHGQKEVITALKHLLTFSRVKFNPDSSFYLFPAIDGVIDLRTGEIRKYRQEDHFTFTYNAYCNHPNPDYRPFLWYLASTFPDIRDCLTVIDLIASVGIRIPLMCSCSFIGAGANGKGILEKLILVLYTMQRASAMKIEEVRKSHFASGPY